MNMYSWICIRTVKFTFYDASADAMEYANTLTIAVESELAKREYELSAAERRMYEDLA